MSHEYPFRLAMLTAAIVQVAIFVPYFRMSQARTTIFRHRDEGVPLSVAIAGCYLAYCLGIVVWLVDPSWMRWSAIPLLTWMRWMGAVVMVAGAVLLVWSLDRLGKHLTISISTKPDHTLVTTGPYRWVRHPLYTSGMIESVGVILLAANWCIAASAIGFWLLVAYRTPLEEQNLLATFGDDYRRYMQQTGRFLPRRARTGDASTREA